MAVKMGLKIVFLIATVLLLLQIFWLFEEYRIRSRINPHDKQIYFSIALVLEKYYGSCKRYPTTEEGLASLNKPTDCLKEVISLKERLSLLSDDSRLIYISDGQKYRLILYNKNYGVDTEK